MPVRHVVGFKFKPETDPAIITKAESDLLALKGVVDGVTEIHWKRNFATRGDFDFVLEVSECNFLTQMCRSLSHRRKH